MLQPTSILQRVPVGEPLTYADWHWIRVSGKALPPTELETELQIEHWHKTGEIQVFRILGNKGIFITEVNTGAGGHRRLKILRYAGDNIAQHLSQAITSLQHTARELGCQAIESMIFNSKLCRVSLKRIKGLRPQAVSVVLEV